MNKRLLILIVIMIGIFAACQAGPPPTQIVMEVTRIVTVVVTPSNQNGPLPVESGTATPEPETTVAPVVETTPEVTEAPSVFPTPIVGQLFVAEQPFQNGRMFWLRPINQIWIITTDAEGNPIWQVLADRFEEGMVETDPTFEPQVTDLRQPIRGFGLIWRENPSIRAQLGYATAEEVGYMANYQYHYGGSVDAIGNFVQGPGYHLIETLSRDLYRFNEGVWTWEVIERAE